jgi:hypothetical protein
MFSALLITLILEGLALSVPVSAAVTTTDYYYGSGNGTYGGYTQFPYSGAGVTWASIQDASATKRTSGGNPDGQTVSSALQYAGASHDDSWLYTEGYIGFNLGTDFNLANISAVTLSIYCTGLTSNAHFDTTFAFFTMHDKTSPFAMNCDNSMCQAAQSERLGGSTPSDYYGVFTSYADTSDLTIDDWYTFTVDASHFAAIKPDANGYFWLGFEAFRYMTNAEPGYSGITQWDASEIQFANDTDHKPYLSIVNTPAARSRTAVIPTNGTTGSAPSNPALNSLTWYTPRYCYTDETVILKYSGVAYSRITPQLIDQAGNVLEATTDQIRNNGIFYWIIQIPNAYTGFLQGKDATFNLFSDWGYCAPSPSYDMPVNTTCSMVNNYPQLQTAFSKYRVVSTDLAIVYWKTNLDGADSGQLADDRLQLWFDGLPGDYVIYDSDFSGVATLNENDASENVMLNDRFMLFTFDNSVLSKYGNAVINLNKVPGAGTWGYYQPVIYETSLTAQLTSTLSCVFYLPASDSGVNIALNQTGYNYQDQVFTTVSIGQYDHFIGNFDKFRIDLYDPTADHYNPDGWINNLDASNFQYEFLAPQAAGSWMIGYEFYNSSLSWAYQFIIPFQIGSNGGGTGGNPNGDVINTINKTVSGWGWGSQGAHWIIIIILCVAEILVAGLLVPNKVVKIILGVALPLMTIAAATMGGFLDIWWVMLIGVLVAFIVAGFVVKTMSGRGG